MSAQVTCWTLVRDAAEGQAEARERFAATYEPAIRAYLGARWRTSAWIQDLDDAVQDVFVECFKGGGALEHADPGRGTDFRAFLYGIVRRVAHRFESGRHRGREARLSTEAEQGAPSDDARLSKAFDEALARAIMQDAARRMAARAAQAGEEAVRRVELLRRRFQDGQPIRQIAAAWGQDPVRVHRAYARARQEFHEALLESIACQAGCARPEAERRAAELLLLLA